MAWLYVFFSAIIEIFWVIGLKYADTWYGWGGTVLLLILSFYTIIKACDRIPAGTVYAVFTGLGAVGIVVVDIFIFKTTFSLPTLLFVGLIIFGVIGVKQTTPEKG